MRFRYLSSVVCSSDLFVDARSPEHFVIIGAIAILAFVLGKSVYLVLLNFLKFRFMTMRKVALMQRLFAPYMFAPYRLHLQRNPSWLMNNVNYEAHNLFSWFLLPLFDLTIEAVDRQRTRLNSSN